MTAKEQAKTIRELISEALAYYDRGINKWGRDRLDRALTQLAAEQKEVPSNIIVKWLRDYIEAIEKSSRGNQEHLVLSDLKALALFIDAEQKVKGELVKDTVTNLLCYILDNHEGEPLMDRKLQEIGMSFMGSKYNKTVPQALAVKECAK